MMQRPLALAGLLLVASMAFAGALFATAAFVVLFAATVGAAFTAPSVSPACAFTELFALAGAFVFFTLSVAIQNLLKSRLVHLSYFKLIYLRKWPLWRLPAAKRIKGDS